MPQFLALTSKGLEEPLKVELEELGFKKLTPVSSGVLFHGTWKDAYRAHLSLKVATRVLLTILDFPAYKPEELYQNILKHDFTKYIEPHQTIAVKATIKDCVFKDQRFVALKVKDAIVDQFREKFQFRPNVDSKDPHLHVHIRGRKNKFSVSIDLSGESLSLRGYRHKSVEAPLREHLAAGLLKISGWSTNQFLLDPFCGSGTFLIEAAMKSQNIYIKRKYAFEEHKIFQKEAYKELLKEYEFTDGVKPEEALKSSFKSEKDNLLGFDINNKALMSAKENAKKAGVVSNIQFKNRDFRNLEKPSDKGVIITNPPYGVRLEEMEPLKRLYSDFAAKLKRDFKGWDLWLLSGHPELSKSMKLKANERHLVYNGNIECRFLKYEIV